MAKCANCGHDNPDKKIFCEKCGSRITPPPPLPRPEHDLQEKIKELQEDLLRREMEIKKLNEDLAAVTAKKNELVGKHPEVETFLQQLEEKDRALQKALKELDDLRSRLPLPVPDSPGAKAGFVIESHPIANPALGITFSSQQESLDLSTTGFRIRASLERKADGSLDLLIHPGATVNIKTPGEKRWRRLEGGARTDTEAGMVLFDPKGAANARLDRSS
jgi:hypothetical protein